MSAALESAQEVEDEQPQDHHNDADLSHDIEGCPLTCNAKDAAVEKECTELCASKAGGAKDIPCDIELVRSDVPCCRRH